MPPTATVDSAVTTRLRPLHIAVALQGFMLWVPIEKLFMTEIGFTAASIGAMAAAYAAVVPIVEIPSGILADRWSRRGVLIVSSVALALTALIGGLSQNVTTYVVSALILGVYFAMFSGTMDSIVYDTVLEETGTSDMFESRIGRVRLIESSALVVSSLLGGWVAGLTSTRLTYFLSVPFGVLAVAAYLRFPEPQLHKAEQHTSLLRHLATTYRTLLTRGRLLPIVTLTVLTAVILQLVFEFGPLWLVALAAPAVLYGPYWAALVSSLGFGGLLAARLDLDKPTTVSILGALLCLTSLVLTTVTGTAVVIIAQVMLAVLVAAASIHVTRLLHDAIPSTIRSGVASGVGAVSWMVFLPVALVFGLVSNQQGVHTAGWLLTVAATVAGLLLVATTLTLRRRGRQK